jgi:GT2 family glycosyltransferase
MDERFFLYMEDVDWCRRFWEAGWKVAYDPAVTVVHRAKFAATKRGVLGLLTRPTWRMLRSYWKYLLKNGMRTSPDSAADAS